MEVGGLGVVEVVESDEDADDDEVVVAGARLHCPVCGALVDEEDIERHLHSDACRPLTQQQLQQHHRPPTSSSHAAAAGSEEKSRSRGQGSDAGGAGEAAVISCDGCRSRGGSGGGAAKAATSSSPPTLSECSAGHRLCLSCSAGGQGRAMECAVLGCSHRLTPISRYFTAQGRGEANALLDEWAEKERGREVLDAIDAPLSRCPRCLRSASTRAGEGRAAAAASTLLNLSSLRALVDDALTLPSHAGSYAPALHHCSTAECRAITCRLCRGTVDTAMDREEHFLALAHALITCLHLQIAPVSAASAASAASTSPLPSSLAASSSSTRRTRGRKRAAAVDDEVGEGGDGGGGRRRGRASSKRKKVPATGDGTGYGGSGVESARDPSAMAAEEAEDEAVAGGVDLLHRLLLGHQHLLLRQAISARCLSVLLLGPLLSVVLRFLHSDSMLDMSGRHAVFYQLLRLVQLCSRSDLGLAPLLVHKRDASSQLSIMSLLHSLAQQATFFLHQSRDQLADEEAQAISLCADIISAQQQAQATLQQQLHTPHTATRQPHTSATAVAGVEDGAIAEAAASASPAVAVVSHSSTPSLPSSGVASMDTFDLRQAPVGFALLPGIGAASSSPSPSSSSFDAGSAGLSREAVTRLRKEWATLSSGSSIPPGIFIRLDEVRIDCARVLIVGPSDTPYEDGLFLFDVLFPADYPQRSPQVRFLTTGGGLFRFNPNLYADGKVCLTGDHRVLTRSGWRFITRVQVGDEVLSFNVDSFAQEWKPVRSVTSHAVDPRNAADCLYRMQGSGMDVIATRDHRMLVARLDQRTASGLQEQQPVGYETVGELLRLPYDATESASTIGSFAHSAVRSVVCAGFNAQPAVRVVIPGLERVCGWWWDRDGQLGFLRFLGFWLSIGCLSEYGAICVGDQEMGSVDWLTELLDAAFPRWWNRKARRSGPSIYTICCPPLYEYLRLMAVGPLGYNPLDPTALRSYPHFAYDAMLAAKESQCRHFQLEGDASWTEAEMLAAMTADEPSAAVTPAPRTRSLSLSLHSPSSVAASVSESALEWDDDADPTVLLFDATPRLLTRSLHSSTASEPLPRSMSLSSDSFGDTRRSSCSASYGDETNAVVKEEAEEVEAEEAVADARLGSECNKGQPIVIDERWFHLKRWLGEQNVADVYSRLSRQQAIALLHGACRADDACSSVQYGEGSGEPTGAWRCSHSSFPLIDHLMLIGQLAGAAVDLHRLDQPGETAAVDGAHWALSFAFTTKSTGGIPFQTAPLARPEDVSSEVDARGYYQHEDDGLVYCIEVQDNGNFLTQRLSSKRSAGGGMGVRAHSVFVANCLSLLGTWQGTPWSAKHSTLLQLLVSIQSMILLAEPFFNEPGWERMRGTEDGSRASAAYNRVIRRGTVKYAILDAITDPRLLLPFGDVVQLHCTERGDSIVQRVERWISDEKAMQRERERAAGGQGAAEGGGLSLVSAWSSDAANGPCPSLEQTLSPLRTQLQLHANAAQTPAGGGNAGV